MKKTFEASGDIRRIDLLAAFVAAWRDGATGSLRFLRNGLLTASFDLADGEVTAVFSAEPRFETSAILVRAGKLDAGALERLSVPPGGDVALAALGAGILTRREWKWGEKIRAIEVLADLLSWPEGEYAFETQSKPARGEFTLTVPRLLLELFLRSRDRHLIDHQLGPTDAPLLRSETFDEEFATFGLTADAESVVRLIDGRASASEISERAPAEEFAVLKLLAALKTLGLLQARENEEIVTTAAPIAPIEGLEAGIMEAPNARIGAEQDGPAAETAETAESSRTMADAGLEDAALDDAASEDSDKAAEPSLEEQWGAAREDFASIQSPAQEPLASELASDWETPAGTGWEPAPPAGEQDREEIAPSPHSGSSRHWAIWLAATFLFLAAAVLTTVWFRSRSAPPIESGAPARRPTAVASAPVERTSSPISASGGLVSVVPTPVPALPAATARPTALAAAPRPTPARASSVAASTGHPEASRTPWLERARRDARRLQSEKRTRYAVQLELACEPATLVEAWTHDRPSGSLWVLTFRHAGRECFRVLWGRFGSLEEAKRAKAGIPSYFVTSTNRPAVVSVR